MKKVLSLILVLAMMFSLVVCCAPAAAAETVNDVQIITKNPSDGAIAKKGSVEFTVESAFDLAENLGKEQAINVASAVIALAVANAKLVPASDGEGTPIEDTALVQLLGEYFTGDNLKMMIGSFVEMKEEGFELDPDAAALVVAVVAQNLGQNGTVDPVIVKALIMVVNLLAEKSLLSLITDGPGTLKFAIEAVMKRDGGIEDLEPDALAAAIAAIVAAKENGLQLDDDAAQQIISGVLGSIDVGGFFRLVIDYLKAHPLQLITLDIKKIAEGLVSPRYQWYVVKNGESIPVQDANDANSYRGADKSTLVVSRSAMPEQTEVYTYYCTVSLLTYNANSDTAKLFVVGTKDAPFSDIDGWYRDYICKAYYLNIAKGYPDGTFKPGALVTREQFITLLWRAAGEPAAPIDAVLFYDKGDILDCYIKAVAWGVETGVIAGYPDNTFRGGNNITRAEMAVMLDRYLDYVGMYDYGVKFPVLFKDELEIPLWAFESVYSVSSFRFGEVSFMVGYPDDTFRANANATRAEATTVMYRLYEALR